MSEDTTYEFIDLAEKPTKADLAAWIVLTKKRFKRGYLAQYLDIRRLKISIGRLNLSEYYVYQLFAKDRAAQEEYLGSGVLSEIYLKANDPKWLPLGSSKIRTNEHMTRHGLPVPKDLALYHPSEEVEGVVRLRSKEALAAYLRDGVSFPFFSKPLTGSTSLGVVSARSYDRASDRLLLSGDKAVELDRFIEGVSHYFEAGYLFQELLLPHPVIAKVSGGRLASVRAMILYEEGGEPELYRAILKVPVGDNVADNAWREGNLLAAVDIATGEITRVIVGWGTEEHEIETHPDTGERLKGLTIPGWDGCLALCNASAKAFPGMRLQAWDMAITERGPVMLEINFAGDFSIPQRAAGKGLLNGRLREFIERAILVEARP